MKIPCSSESIRFFLDHVRRSTPQLGSIDLKIHGKKNQLIQVIRPCRMVPPSDVNVGF